MTQLQRDPLSPFAWYAAMRSSAPVLADPRSGTWQVFRYADVQRALSDYEVFSSQMGGHEAISQSLISTDPPRHRQLRALVTQAFTPRTVEGLGARIQAITDELLDRVMDVDEFDLVRDLAYPLPVIVIAEMLGVPAEERDRFKDWSDKIT